MVSVIGNSFFNSIDLNLWVSNGTHLIPVDLTKGIRVGADSSITNLTGNDRTTLKSNSFTPGDIVLDIQSNINGINTSVLIINAAGDIVPINDQQSSIGEEFKQIKKFFSSSVHDHQTFLSLYNVNVYNDLKMLDGDILLGGDIIPTVDRGSSIGNIDFKLKNFHSSNINDSLTDLRLYNCTIYDDLKLQGVDIIPDDDIQSSIGSSLKRFKNFYSRNVEDDAGFLTLSNCKILDDLGLFGNIMPSPDKTLTLGADFFRFKEIWSTNFVDNFTDIQITSKLFLNNNVLFLGSTNNEFKIQHNIDSYIQSESGHLRLEVNESQKNVFIDLSTDDALSHLTIRSNSLVTLFKVFGDGVTSVSGTLRPHFNGLYTLGTSSRRWTEVFAQNGVINTSDQNEKKDIEDGDLGLDFILDLKPKKYKWNNGTRTHYGLLAQDVYTSLKGKDFGGYIDSKYKEPNELQTFGLRDHEFTGVLIKAIQEQQTRIEDLEKRIINLEK